MKRILVTILALIYLTITSGVLINVHFCMGEIASVNYGHDASNTCEKCGMESKAGCCSTETAFVKVSEQQKSETSTSLHAPAPQIAHIEYGGHFVIAKLSGAKISRQTHSPTLDPAQSLTVLYRNFRI